MESKNWWTNLINFGDVNLLLNEFSNSTINELIILKIIWALNSDVGVSDVQNNLLTNIVLDFDRCLPSNKIIIYANQHHVMAR